MILEARIKFFVLILSGLLLGGCFFQSTSQDSLHEIKGNVFGSYYLVKFRGDLDKEAFQRELDALFLEFNREFSTYQEDSVISRFNKVGPGEKFPVSRRFLEMLRLAKKFHKDTDGAFEPTLGPLIKAWGFGGGKMVKNPETEYIKRLLKNTGFSFVKWDEERLLVWKERSVELDVNAFVPGWAADLIGEMLRKRKIKNFMVDISGEILFHGQKSETQEWIAGIEIPSLKHAEGVQKAFKIKNLAIATSGNYRQFFDDKGMKRGHILDPKTGHPVHHQISSASVLAPSAASADAWSTALMVLGKEGLELAEKHGIKVLLLEAKEPQVFEEISSPGMKSYIEEYQL